MPAIVRGWPWSQAEDGIYWGCQKLRGVDHKSFVVLSDAWARDDRSVYSCGSRIRDADPESFRVLNEHYALDKSRVYTARAPIEGADPASFRVVGPTFHDFNVTNGYAVDGSAVYHTEYLYKARVLKSADCRTFRSLGRGYACDDTSVFFEAAKLSSARPDDWRHIAGPHSVSGKHAYWLAKRIKGADGGSLESLPSNSGGWSRSGSSYFRCDTLADAKVYGSSFSTWFIFIGRVVNLELSCERYDPVSLSDPDPWRIARHVWVDVQAAKWLQRPQINLRSELTDGQPIRFGEGLRLRSLASPEWRTEERIWILYPVQHPGHREPHMFLYSIDQWWEYSDTTNLPIVNELIQMNSA